MQNERKLTKKLILAKETISELTALQLGMVAGGSDETLPETGIGSKFICPHTKQAGCTNNCGSRSGLRCPYC